LFGIVCQLVTVEDFASILNSTQLNFIIKQARGPKNKKKKQYKKYAQRDITRSDHYAISLV